MTTKGNKSTQVEKKMEMTTFQTYAPNQKSFMSLFGGRKNQLRSSNASFDLYQDLAYIKPDKVILRKVEPKKVNFNDFMRFEEEEEGEDEFRAVNTKYVRKKDNVDERSGKFDIPLRPLSPSGEQNELVKSILCNQPTQHWDVSEDPERYTKAIAPLPAIHLSRSLNDLSNLKGITNLPTTSSSTLPDFHSLLGEDQQDKLRSPSTPSKALSSPLLSLIDRYRLVMNKESLIEREIENLVVNDGEESTTELSIRFLLGKKLKSKQSSQKQKFEEQIRVRKTEKFSIAARDRDNFQSAVNLRANSKEFWIDDKYVDTCYKCENSFSVFTRKHHCRICGQIYCWKCCSYFMDGREFGVKGHIRVCQFCVDLHTKKMNMRKKRGGGDIISYTSTTRKRNLSGKRMFDRVQATRKEDEPGEKQEKDAENNNNNNNNENESDNNNNNNNNEDDDDDTSDEEALGDEEDHKKHSKQGEEHVEKILQSSRGGKKKRVYMTKTLDRLGFSYFKDHKSKQEDDKEYEIIKREEVIVSNEKESVNNKRKKNKKKKNKEEQTDGPDKKRSGKGGGDQDGKGTPVDLNDLVKQIPSSDEEDSDYEGEKGEEEEEEEEEDKEKEKKNKESGEKVGRSDEEEIDSENKFDLKNVEIVGNNISIDEFVVEYEKHIESLDHICMKHLQRLVRQLLRDNEVQTKHLEEWYQIITGLVLKIVNTMKVDTLVGDKMDIRHYIKIKKLPGGTIYETEYFPGIVFWKHMVKKTMKTDFTNPRVLMLRTSLTHEGQKHLHSRLRRVDLEIIMRQEKPHLEMLVKKILRYQPDILLLENSCNGFALRLLEKEGVSVMTNVKKQILRKIGRCNDLAILFSMNEIDIPNALGTCEKTFLRKVEIEEEVEEEEGVDENKEDKEDEEKQKKKKLKKRKKVKFLYFVKSNQEEKGCTVLLRGERLSELVKLKKILNFAVFAGHHLKRECEVFFESGGSYVDVEKFSSSVERSLRKVYDEEREGEEEEDYDEDEEKIRKKILSISPDVYFESPNIDRSKRPDVYDRIMSPLMHQNIVLLFQSYVISHSEESSKLYNQRLFPIYLQKKGNKQLATRKKRDKANKAYIQPEIIIVAYYTENDMSVGKYLHTKCFSPQSVTKYLEKIRCYIHSTGKVSLRITKITPEFMKCFYDDKEEIEELISTGVGKGKRKKKRKKKKKHMSRRKKMIVLKMNEEGCFPFNTIFTWSYCKKCGRCVMPVRPISKSYFNLSFGKFLESTLYNHRLMCRGIGGCEHSIHQNHIRAFGFRNIVATFEYTPVDVFEVIVPAIKTEIDEEYNDVRFSQNVKGTARADLDEFLRALVQMQEDEETAFHLSRKHKDWLSEFDEQMCVITMNGFLKHLQAQLQNYIADIMNKQLGIKKITKSLHMLVRRFQKEKRVIRCILKPNPFSPDDQILVELVVKDVRNTLVTPPFLHRKYYGGVDEVGEEESSISSSSAQEEVEGENSQHHPPAHLSQSVSDQETSGSEAVLKDYHCWDIPVVFGDPSSIIAHSLSCKEYKSEVGSSYKEDSPEVVLKSRSKYHFELERDFSGRKNGFQIKCYFEKQFAALRDLYLCDKPKEFIKSMMSGNIWKPTGGKSRSIFFKTWDNRYVIKTLQHVEMESFLDTADEYFEYLSSALFRGLPTCLMKVFGCYRVHWYCKGRLHRAEMMVMENLFYNRNISVSYDLKGSMRNRYVRSKKKAGDKEEQQPPQPQPPQPLPPPSSKQQQNDENQQRKINIDKINRVHDKTLLDENLLEQIIRGNPFVTKEHCKERLSRSIHNDSLFLSKLNIMDYSLLTGVDPEKKEFVVGIVDFLRQYSWDKHLETWIKSSFDYTSSVPTVISPRNYKIRFREAIEKYFILSPSKFSGLLE